MPTIDDRLTRIEAVLIHAGLMKPGKEKPGGSPIKPVNYVAFDSAIAEFARGNRKPLDEYLDMYRVPKERR